jgi:hypothetical protein
LISQDKILVTKFFKQAERFWLQSEWGAGEILRIESLDCEISVDELYLGINFESETGQTDLNELPDSVI